MRASILGVALLGLTAIGCSGATATRLVAHTRTDNAAFWVENHGNDGRQLEQIIAGALTKRGLDAASGSLGQRPENADFVVTYVDRWGWDMRTYLQEIRIDVTDARSGAIVGTSRSHQSSLPAMGKTYAEIIETTVNNLLDGAP